MTEMIARNQKVYDFVITAGRSQGAFTLAAEKFGLTRARVSAIVKALDKKAGIVPHTRTKTVTMGPWKTTRYQFDKFTALCEKRNWSRAHGMNEAIKFFVDHITPGQIEESNEKGGTTEPAEYPCTMSVWRTEPTIRDRFVDICQVYKWSYAEGMRAGMKYYIENQ